ncbi:hypothetical protein E1162_02960 [Rhodobacteraceae bacterium RKSG542]|uniref:hypothetical protein n=1 Tax=Pseudovibrio flavus TaxID=2529854 RepID=UPI0012BBE1CB|nr:hypothetical protein [Pseudovibrio flavus]MTI16195.1 hypothetical protein [Pseudovibrio flavus]
MEPDLLIYTRRMGTQKTHHNLNPFDSSLTGSQLQVFEVQDRKGRELLRHTQVTAFPPFAPLLPVRTEVLNIKEPRTNNIELLRWQTTINEERKLSELFDIHEGDIFERLKLPPSDIKILINKIQNGPVAGPLRDEVRLYIHHVIENGQDKSPEALMLLLTAFSTPGILVDYRPDQLLNVFGPLSTQQRDVAFKHLIIGHKNAVADGKGYPRKELKGFGLALSSFPREYQLRLEPYLSELALDVKFVRAGSYIFSGLHKIGPKSLPTIYSILVSNKQFSLDIGRRAPSRRSYAYLTALENICRIAKAHALPDLFWKEIAAEGLVHADKDVLIRLRALGMPNSIDASVLPSFKGEPKPPFPQKAEISCKVESGF